ncbi:unnamed protein product [Adineta ricciae]|uniref:Nuclear receptor domain-containing protein n=1 Tax=Adineta ricciae TaxID=249248 RepID=A0A813YAW8_ADIRI|nr:unnamed protein product [Adineta ricciae]CAF1358079.1 unnamed protein product [Adineta ricciae]
MSTDFNEILPDEFIDIDDLFSLPLDFISNDGYDALAIFDNEPVINEHQTISSIPTIDEDAIERLTPPNSSEVDYISNLVCRVCGSRAYGYNFDQITCESCKAFFRRNAFKDLSNFKCHHSGLCIITEQTRRRCTYCRLKKCFDVKMRKDWIRTDEERQFRKMINSEKERKKSINDQQIVNNFPLVVRKKKRLTLLMKKISNSKVNYFLSDDDRSLLNNITNAYQKGISQTDGFRIYKCTSTPSLVEYMNNESHTHETLIHFFKSIPQFKQISISDQISLIKFNQLTLIHLHYIVIRNFRENLLVGQLMTEWVNGNFHQQMSKTRRYFDMFIEYPLILKLTLVVLIFSTSLSMPHCYNDQFSKYENQKQIFECQSYYISLLWRYLNHLFEEKQAIRSFQLIVTQLLRFQTLMNFFEEFAQQDRNRHSFNQLMKSIILFK